MLIDLHCHTRVHSPCSNLDPAELIALAKQAGLDGVCLTEHDRTWDAADLAALAAEHAFLVLGGMEVTTEQGHVLVFGLDRYLPDMAIAGNLRRHVDRARGFMALAHPTRDEAHARRDPAVVRLFDAVEVMNGSDGRLRTASVGWGLPGIAGSDAHARHEVGTCATRFDGAIRDERDLIQALRAGRFAPEALR
ncbi:MAG TPA: PHP domain-containing protein [Dehalococcoidia bacterium]|nr:PHP domain-containing protein [Dehalococcoidia bacterium]